MYNSTTGTLVASDGVKMITSDAYNLMVAGFCFSILGAMFLCVDDFGSCIPSCKSDKTKEEEKGCCGRRQDKANTGGAASASAPPPAQTGEIAKV